MLKIGDKIKYVKANPLIEMPIGTEMTVTDIKGTTVAVEASFQVGNCKAVVQGLMSYDEVEKYFEKVVETERVWTEWESVQNNKEIPQCQTYACGECNKCWFNAGCDMFNMSSIEYRTNNNKVMVRCKIDDNKYIKSEATCHKTDEFDLVTGLKIAVARLAVKKAEYTLKTIINEIG